MGEWIDINAVVIEDAKGFQSVGTSQGFPIPDKYINEIKETELGKVMEITRIDLTKNAFIMALTKHINREIWK